MVQFHSLTLGEPRALSAVPAEALLTLFVFRKLHFRSTTNPIRTGTIGTLAGTNPFIISLLFGPSVLFRYRSLDLPEIT